MGPLFSVLAALVALTLAQAGVGATEPRPEVLLFGLLLPHGIGLAARRASLQGQTDRARRLERLLAASGWMGYAALVLGGGWLGANAPLEKSGQGQYPPPVIPIELLLAVALPPPVRPSPMAGGWVLMW